MSGERRCIRRKYGKLKVYAKSLIFDGIVMYVQQDPEHIPDLILKLDEMLDQAFASGRYFEQQRIAKAYTDFRNTLGEVDK